MKIKIGDNHAADLFPLELQQTTFKVYHALIYMARRDGVDGVLHATDIEIAATAGVGHNTTTLKCLYEIKALGRIKDLKRGRVEGKGLCNTIVFHKRKAKKVA